MTLSWEGCQYVNDGSRAISHETGIQDFLVKEFGFEKACTGLQVHFRLSFGQLHRMACQFRAVVTPPPPTEVLFELARLRVCPYRSR